MVYNKAKAQRDKREYIHHTNWNHVPAIHFETEQRTEHSDALSTERDSENGKEGFTKRSFSSVRNLARP